MNPIFVIFSKQLCGGVNLTLIMERSLREEEGRQGGEGEAGGEAGDEGSREIRRGEAGGGGERKEGEGEDIILIIFY